MKFVLLAFLAFTVCYAREPVVTPDSCMAAYNECMGNWVALLFGDCGGSYRACSMREIACRAVVVELPYYCYHKKNLDDEPTKIAINNQDPAVLRGNRGKNVHIADN